MSNKYKPNEMEQEFLTSVKSISISLKEIKAQFIIKNKIDSIRIAFNLTYNKTFSTLTKEQSKKVMREVNGQLNNISESIYGKWFIMNIDKELIKLYEELINMYQKELQKEIKANKYLNDTIDRLINE